MPHCLRTISTQATTWWETSGGTSATSSVRCAGSAIRSEEYTDGREIYVGVFGNKRLAALPPQELFFKRLPDGASEMLTYRAKSDEVYRKR